MATTAISDVIVPEVFNPYVIQRTADLINMYMGGMVSTNAELNRLAMSGGKLINMPYWDDLSGDDAVLSDSSPLVPVAVTSGQDIAALIMRGKAWSVNDLARALSGDDPMGAVAQLVADYKVRKLQDTLISSLTGVFADNIANDSNDMVVDVAVEVIASQTDDTKFNANSFVDAVMTLGDAFGGVSGLAVHSQVLSTMAKNDLIAYVEDSNGNLSIPTYMGKSVIVNDSCPVTAGSTDGFKYDCFIFGSGAVGFGDGSAPVPTETDRDSLAGNDILIHRWHSILHPRGVAFQSASVAGASPTNDEFKDAANWDRVYDRKNIRLAKLVVNA